MHLFVIMGKNRARERGEIVSTKEKICRVCGGKLKNCGTYDRCERCGRENLFHDSALQGAAQTDTAQRLQDMMAQIAQLQAELERLQTSVAAASQPASAQPPAPEREDPYHGQDKEDFEIKEEVTEYEVLQKLVKYEGDGKEVAIPDGITNIEKNAFLGCSDLTDIAIPDSVTKIDEYAFAGCSGLTKLIIPASVMEIGEYAFAGCSGLTDIWAQERRIWLGELGNYRSKGNCLIKKSVRQLVLGCKNSVIPTDGSVTGIAMAAFFGCSALASITIPNNVISIGKEAFKGCVGLKRIVIPNSVVLIGEGAFADCSGLTSIVVQEGNRQYYGKGDCIIERSTQKLILGCKASAIPADGSVASIGDRAFSGCSGLTNITIPNGVTSIGNGAFNGCGELINVTIPDSMKIIEEKAFCGCRKLSEVTVPENVIIEPTAFESHTTIKFKYSHISVVAKGTESDFEIEDGVLIKYKGKRDFVIIPDGVKDIGGFAFSHCSRLKSIIIPNSVTSIGACAFHGCSELTSITIPNYMRSIGDWAFYCCSGLTSIVMPKYLAYIGDGAFEGCKNLSGIMIPNGVTSIGNSTFCNCSGLTRVTIPNHVRSIGDWAFYGCSRLINTVMPKYLAYIGDGAFEGCSRLKSIVIPNSVTNIGRRAFRFCKNLSEVTVPYNVRIVPETFDKDVKVIYVDESHDVLDVEFSGLFQDSEQSDEYEELYP